MTLRYPSVVNDGIATREEMMDHFLGAFPNRFMHLSSVQRKISVQIYRLLVEGEPVPIERIAIALELSKSDVESVIKSWPGVLYNDEGSVVGYWGLTLQRMRHRFLVSGRTLYTWCSWDSLFIPQIIGNSAQIESTDPLTNCRIRLTIAPEHGIRDVDPSGTVLSFMMPNAEKIRADVLTSFCHYVYFFDSAGSAIQWISNSDKKDWMVVLSLQEAYDLGLRKNRLQYGKALEV